MGALGEIALGVIPDQFWEVIYFLATAIVVSITCKKLNITSVLGYLLAGVVLGPNVLNIFSDVEVSKHIAEFGVVFLMFTIGLELPWERLQELKKYVFGMGFLQVALTSILFGSVSLYFGASHEMAILLGVGLSFSSTAVVLQILSDQKEITSRFGRISFSTLLFQDLMVIVVLVWVTMAQGSSRSVLTILGLSVAKVVSVFVGFTLFGRYLLRPIYGTIVATRNSDLFFALTLLIILTTSFVTDCAGLSLGLGAFLGGLLLAETEYKHRVEADIKPFRSLLLGLFFMTVGMTLNPQLLIEKANIIFGMLSLLILGKVSIFLIVTMIMRIPTKTAIQIAILMAGGSEFVFVLFKQAEISGLIGAGLNQMIYLVVVVSMLLSPLLALLGPVIAKRIGKDIGLSVKAASDEAIDMKNHVIIVGFNFVGESLHNILAIRYIPHIIIDMSVNRVAKARLKNYPIFFGDAKKISVFDAVNVGKAKAVVVSLDDYELSQKITQILRKQHPHLKVLVRAQDSAQAIKIQKMGASPIIPEIFAPSFQLATAVFELFGINAEQTEMIIDKYKKNLFTTQKFSLGKGL